MTDQQDLRARLPELPPNVEEGLHYFFETGDDGDRIYVTAIRQYIAVLRSRITSLSQTAGVPDVLSGLRFHCDKGARGTVERLRRYSKQGDNKRNLLGQTMEEAANIIDRLLAAVPAASGGDVEKRALCERLGSLDEACHATDAGDTIREAIAALSASKQVGAGDTREVIHCPACDAPCKATVHGRGGDWGWGTTDEERTTYKYEGYTTAQPAPQPGAEAMRELVQRWRTEANKRYGSDYELDTRFIYKYCSDELESLLARGGK